VRIRPAVPSDVPVLLAIEEAADGLFAGVGMAEVAGAGPWNAPYYRRLGFREMPDAAIGPGLHAIVRREAAQGVGRWPRVAMIRSVSGADRASSLAAAEDGRRR
jgi:hypothetical protein